MSLVGQEFWIVAVGCAKGQPQPQMAEETAPMPMVEPKREGVACQEGCALGTASWPQILVGCRERRCQPRLKQSPVLRGAPASIQVSITRPRSAL